MPNKSGYDATSEHREWEKTHGGHTPIVAMTANAMIGDRQKCLDCGMDEYISKPIQKDLVVNVMKQWINFFSKDEPAEPEVKVQKPLPIDLSALHGIIGDDKSAERSLLELFLQDSEKSLELLSTQCVDEPSETWREAAHRMKGGAANVGAQGLRSLCEQAQHLEKATSKERQKLYKEIQTAFLDVKTHLQQEGLI